MWPTVTVQESSHQYGSGNHNDIRVKLTGAVRLWRTPLSLNHGKTGNIAGQNQLGVQVRLWATPTARDWRSDSSRKSDAELYKGKGRPLSRQVRTMPKAGALRSQLHRNSHQQLNARFVEWLMGLPLGWTDFGHSATRSFRLWQRTHSALWQQLCSKTEAQ